MDRLTDRLAAWVVRTCGTLLLFAGVSVIVAGVPLFGMLSEAPVARMVAGVFLQISGVFIVAGGAAIYLSRPRGLLLPNERAATPEAEPPQLGGWLIALAVLLIALPVWLVLRLRPFLAEWVQVAGLLATPGLWNGANANMSGVILVPVAGALTPPLFELLSLLAFVLASAMLLVLLLSRSWRFPRTYLGCVVLLSALVMASVRGAAAAVLAGEAIEQLIATTSASSEESAQLLEGLGRYTSIVTSTAPPLMWALVGYLVWVPAMIFSQRVRTTFAGRVDARVGRPATATDIEAITSPPRFPG